MNPTYRPSQLIINPEAQEFSLQLGITAERTLVIHEACARAVDKIYVASGLLDAVRQLVLKGEIPRIMPDFSPYMALTEFDTELYGPELVYLGYLVSAMKKDLIRKLQADYLQIAIEEGRKVAEKLQSKYGKNDHNNI